MSSPVSLPVRAQIRAAAVRPPVIGISGATIESQSVQQMMAQVRAAGGIPMVFANHAARSAAEDIGKIDALVVMGNDADVDPKRYMDRYAANDPRRQVHPQTRSTAAMPETAARAAYEEEMLRLAAMQQLPTLAVCGGMHLANVMHGGGLLQHIPDQIGDNHHQQNTLGVPGVCPVIPVTIHDGTALCAIARHTPTIYAASIPPAGDIAGTVNSFHHQAVDPDLLGRGFRVAAASDTYRNVQGETRRLVEAIEPDPAGPLARWPMIGVQWHPEFGDSAVSAAIIADVVAKGAARTVHSRRDARFDQTAAMVANLRSARQADRGFVEAAVRRLPQEATQRG